MNTSFGLGYSTSFGFTSFIYFDPALTLQYRYYYNYAKREAKGKRTEMNSLNYVCSILETDFSKAIISNSYYPETKRRAINTFGLAWGFQRNYQKRFSVDLNWGGGHLYTKVTYKWFNYLKTKGHYIKGYVIMPNHLHTLIDFGVSLNRSHHSISFYKSCLIYIIIHVVVFGNW